MEDFSVVPIRYLKGIGPKRAKMFNKLGVNTIEDLLYYFPRRYEDRTKLTPISGLVEGQIQTIKARVLVRGGRFSWRRSGFNITEIVVGDKTGKISCVWFNQSYLRDYFNVGVELILYGKVETYSGRLQMSSPEFEIVEAVKDCGNVGPLNTGRIVPVYGLGEGVTQRNLRKTIKSALDTYLPKINEFLPYDIRSRINLLNLAKSLLNIHFPESQEIQRLAYERLAFEEFFIFQLPLVLRKLKKKQEPGIAHKVEGDLLEKFLKGLPFKLTGAQERVISEIKSDMASPSVMQRLVEGDVGSGKTVVATVAAVISIQGGYQAAFMAPTEILAKQHYEKIRGQGTGFKVQDGIKVGLLTSSLNKKEKEKICKEIKEGKIDLIIGTHALLEGDVAFKNLGLVIIDEQHKFGVGQRALLPAKGRHPDVLIMTATPIPRTLAITLYGDLDASVIDELPPGRGNIKTMRFSEKERGSAYEIARQQLKAGHQVYIVYPVIEESFAMDMTGAKKMYERLKEGEFKDFRLGLIHGRLKQDEQNKLMQKFNEGHLDILIATTVLELGIDIANATCMVIENAERFGLAQLHQLRGRVGRGSAESFCLVMSDTDAQDAVSRLEAMVKYNNGFSIAQEDLRIRGPGEFFGQRQHGLTELRIANPLTQMKLLKKAHEEAVKLLSADPKLEQRPNLALKDKLLRRFPEYEKLMVV